VGMSHELLWWMDVSIFIVGAFLGEFFMCVCFDIVVGGGVVAVAAILVLVMVEDC